MWDVGAFDFAGDETAISVSGKDDKAANRTIQEIYFQSSFIMRVDIRQVSPLAK